MAATIAARSRALAPCARPRAARERRSRGGVAPAARPRFDRATRVASFPSSESEARRVSRIVRTRASSSDDADATCDPVGRGPCGAIPGLKSDEVVLVVGGAGRVGRRLVSTLVNCGVRVRVMTRDADSVAARELASKFSDATSSALLEIVEGDVTDDDDARIERAVAGCTRVVACHGAERIARVADLFSRPELTDKRHPRFVNYLGVERLAKAAAKTKSVRRFVRVTGMSVGYAPMHPIAVLLNVVLSMSIQWQLAGEVATRSIVAAAGKEYAVVRPGNLSDAPRPENSVVIIGHGGAHVRAGKVSRDDVADCVFAAAFAVRSIRWFPYDRVGVVNADP
eukprot:30895-Pelagococcus_subviridis.AAC.10